MDARKEVVEAFIQATLKDHVLAEGMPRTSVDTQDAYQTVGLLRALCAKVEALEARVAAADTLAEAVTHEREMVCQDFGMQQDAAIAVHNALAAYRAAKEGGA